MRVGEINEMLHKTEELKALFVFGQRVIPFLEEIFLFIREVTPLLENINISIEENLSKMPKASQQLSNVTRATELATTEILDTLDGLSYKADVISSNLKQLLTIQRQNQQEHERIIAAVQQLQSNETTPIEQSNSIYVRLTEVIQRLESREGKGSSTPYQLSVIQSALQTLQQPSSEQPQVSDELVASSEKLLESIRMDSTQIMMSLQVQDITSQQLAAVNGLLQTVQVKLSEIMTHFRNTEIGELIATATRTTSKDTSSEEDAGTQVVTMHRTIAYDHDISAALSNDPSRQDSVDSIMSRFYNGADTDNDKFQVPAQGDIDALFSQSQQALPSDSSSEAASQNDIDALFGGGSAPSQDDIDALFAGQ
jgi:chemotaxis regulatin CheY-phosphate phosphatase CheZ